MTRLLTRLLTGFCIVLLALLAVQISAHRATLLWDLCPIACARDGSEAAKAGHLSLKSGRRSVRFHHPRAAGARIGSFSQGTRARHLRC